MIKAFASAVFLLPTICFGAGWTNPFYIEDVYVYGTSNTILVKTSGTTVYDTVNGCSANFWSVVASDEAQRSRMFAGLLSAQLAGRPIRFWWIEGCGISNSQSANVLRLPTE